MIKTLLLSISLSITLLLISPNSQAEATDMAALKAKLVSIFKAEPSSIKVSPVTGIYEIGYGMDIIYVSADGKYFFSGELFDLRTRKNLTESTLMSERKKVMDGYDTSKNITFKAAQEKHVISVFTDIDCPYCAKLHNEVPALNKAGITVRYYMYPRAGINSASFKKAVSVWCNEDQNAALTAAKNRTQVVDKSCDNPIKDQFLLGQKIGVTGTPAIVLNSGELIPGYRPAKALISMIQAKSTPATK
jgi:thiol:disulfide interchange protein DsbC